MTNLLRRFAVLAALVVFVGLVFFALRRGKVNVGTPTVADLGVVHPGVSVEGDERRGLSRLAKGARAATDGDGRARIRLDDGTTALVDRTTKLSVDEGMITLESGRLFVLGAPGAKTEVKIGDATVRVGSSNAGLERRDGPGRVYSANEEIVVTAGASEHKVRSGESARIEGTNVAVAPEKAFDDWTGGLAAPWGASGTPRRAVGELWGREAGKAGDAGSPLTIRAHDVAVTMGAELAITRVKTTYFNGGSQSLQGDFRMALPPSAIVSRFAYGATEPLQEATIALASREEWTLTPSGALLEWAGEGWVRGHLPFVASGSTVTVELEYVEWLSVGKTGDGKLVAEYRYPLAAVGDPPLIGEFSAKIDATLARPRSISSGSGGIVSGDTVQLRRPDFRPTADFVVSAELPPWESPVRLYAAQPNAEEAFATVLVRADLPEAGPDAGATLALVVDTSGSTEASELDVERAFVRAVLDTLGTRDQVIVLAADQRVRPVGPATIGPLDAARKAAIIDALGKLTPGGASDLGRAIEAGADALPADVPAGIVVYVGDGWATVGDPDVPAIEARLARRVTGKPRLGAVSVGPLAHARALRALTRGSGPLYSITDSSEANAAATSLVSEALRPAYSNVEIVLGPEIEQVYPRSARSALAGTTIEAVGRVRGSSPSKVTLRWRDKKGLHEETRLVSLRTTPKPDDIRRRWAEARVAEVLQRARGREAATDVALRAGLLTPWTGLVVGAPTFVGTVLEARQLDVAIGDAAAPFAQNPSSSDGVDQAFGALTSVPYAGSVDATGNEKELEDSVGSAANYVLDTAIPSVRACRDSRATLRPDLHGSINVSLSIDGDGKAHDVKVRGESPLSNDDALNRCVEVALEGMKYPESGLTTRVKVSRSLLLPEGRPNLRGAKCSALSTLPLPLRRGIWRARLGSEKLAPVYVAAKRSCELPGWADARALLELGLLVNPGGMTRIEQARLLESAGDTEAAAFIRREAVRRATNAAELDAVKKALVGEERYPKKVFQKRYLGANDDAARLAVVRRFMTIAPHDGLLRSRLIALLESLGAKDELREEARRIRIDPFAPAELLADVASTLRRIGDEDEARRTFGELAERAPADPWARAFLGDRLRNEGWFDDATATYAALGDLAPEDPGAAIRLALAHAGAGRLDIARRLLSRVVETGGRLGNAPAGVLAGHVASSLLGEARGRAGLAKEQSEGLIFAALEIPRSERRVVVLVRGPAASDALDLKLARKVKGEDENIPVEITAATMGLYALAFETGPAEVELAIKRAEELPPARPTKIRIDALVPSDQLSTPPALITSEIVVPPTGKPVTLTWGERGFVAKDT